MSLDPIITKLNKAQGHLILSDPCQIGEIKKHFELVITIFIYSELAILAPFFDV